MQPGGGGNEDFCEVAAVGGGPRQSDTTHATCFAIKVLNSTFLFSVMLVMYAVCSLECKNKACATTGDARTHSGTSRAAASIGKTRNIEPPSHNSRPTRKFLPAGNPTPRNPCSQNHQSAERFGNRLGGCPRSMQWPLINMSDCDQVKPMQKARMRSVATRIIGILVSTSMLCVVTGCPTHSCAGG